MRRHEMVAGQVVTRAVDSPNPEPRRIGVWVRGDGLDIAVIARHATRVQFCVVDPDGSNERRWDLLGPQVGIWHGHIEGLGEGTHYGFRVDGPWDPDAGMFHNPRKFLLDPYGRGLIGEVDNTPGVYAHRVDDELYPTSYPLEISSLDSLSSMPHSVVVGNNFPIAAKPRIPWNMTVLYELHVKGFTKNMPGVPPELRGTYAGLAHPACVEYLRSLGVTTIELLPIHAKCDETFLTERGLTNYWGYSTLSYFAPEPSYASEAAQSRGAQGIIDEFRGMVSILHQAGIEVVLDVVYNHTCEGGSAGPTLSWRGLDQGMYYRQTPHRPRQQIDTTGCGNTINIDHAQTMAMILDSLRYWSEEMGVDGFRFDLAATLGRFAWGYTPLHPLLLAIATDDRLSRDKMIAEPWDIGPGGWQTGNFPDPFAEWNDQFRGAVRSFWLGDASALSRGHHASGPNALATRMAGSQDVFSHGAGYLRGPAASVNFVTAHDGFTLADLTAYDHKHNLANLEGNRDGTDDNRSWNHGLEGAVATPPAEGLGDTVDASGYVEDLFPARRRSQRNLLTTILVSAGTPMITAGDEFQRTQFGNNNAYCQDGPISWIDWTLSQPQLDQVATTRWLLSLRRNHPVFRPTDFASGQIRPGDTIADLAWFTASGEPMYDGAWGDAGHRTFQMLRSGVPLDDRDLLVVINGSLDDREVTLPPGHGVDWLVVMDTDWTSPADGGIDVNTQLDSLPLSLERLGSGETLMVEPLSMMVLLSDIKVEPGA